MEWLIIIVVVKPVICYFGVKKVHLGDLRQRFVAVDTVVIYLLEIIYVLCCNDDALIYY